MDGWILDACTSLSKTHSTLSQHSYRTQNIARPFKNAKYSRNTKMTLDNSEAFKLFPATNTSSIHNDQGPPHGSNNLAVTTTR